MLVLSNGPLSSEKSFESSLTCPKGTHAPFQPLRGFREYFDAIWKELDVHVC